MIQTIIYLLAAIGILALLFFIWKFPKWQTKKIEDINKKDKWKAENEFRKTLLQVSGGLILILSLIFTWRGMNQSQENIETGHQITRFNQAIKFLSEKSTTLKLGGIYTLEHIVRESPERYLGSVIEILSAFVKDAEVIYLKPKDFETWKSKYAPNDREVQILYLNKIKSKIMDDFFFWPKEKIDDFNRWLKEQDDKNEELNNLLNKLYNRWKKYNYEIKPETQVALTVLGRIRTEKNKDIWENLPRINLINVNLRGSELTGANLRGANLFGANLMGAYLREANLMDANLHGANLTEANLMDANLQGAYLMEANLTEANLFGADLRRSDLIESDLWGADLWGANLFLAKLWGANLSYANLMEANLQGADLRDANLTSAQFLSVKQLIKVKSLWNVICLPPEMEKELREKKPELFEDPFK